MSLVRSCSKSPNKYHYSWYFFLKRNSKIVSFETNAIKNATNDSNGTVWRNTIKLILGYSIYATESCVDDVLWSALGTETTKWKWFFKNFLAKSKISRWFDKPEIYSAVNNPGRCQNANSRIQTSIITCFYINKFKDWLIISNNLCPSQWSASWKYFWKIFKCYCPDNFFLPKLDCP